LWKDCKAHLLRALSLVEFFLVNFSVKYCILCDDLERGPHVASLGKSSTICNLSVIISVIVKPSKICICKTVHKKKKVSFIQSRGFFAYPFVDLHVSPRGHFFFRNCLVGATVSLRVLLKPHNTNKEETFKGKKESDIKGNQELSSLGKKESCSLDNKKSL
jgi:hypothetical protein